MDDMVEIYEMENPEEIFGNGDEKDVSKTLNVLVRFADQDSREETTKIARALGLSTVEYIRRAVQLANKINRERLKEKLDKDNE